MGQIQLSDSWKAHLEPEFRLDYMSQLRQFLAAEYAEGKTIYPSKKNYFACFQETTLEDLKVVILGQDPYHGPGQAHGLSFSVPSGIPLPPSLLNIFKERESDVKIPLTRNGDLTAWAKQGVLLLNSVLTVEAGKAASHRGRGWETFTHRVIQTVNEQSENVCFVLWGADAQKKRELINEKKHLILSAPHPSPLSSHRGFFGSKPFSKINSFRLKKGLKEIDWRSDFLT